MPLGKLFARKDPAPDALYTAAVHQARRPVFYERLEVPDSLDGRFELVALHVFLILRRLRSGDGRARDLAQALFDTMFHDMDGSLRELGVGDPGVGPKVKRMAQGFYGRIAAYSEGLDGEPGILRDALKRNLYGTVGAVAEDTLEAMESYVRQQDRQLLAQATGDLMAGKITFTLPNSTTGHIGSDA